MVEAGIVAAPDIRRAWTPSPLSDAELREAPESRAEDWRAYRAQVEAIDDRVAGLGHLKATADNPRCADPQAALAEAAACFEAALRVFDPVHAAFEHCTATGAPERQRGAGTARRSGRREFGLTRGGCYTT